MSQAAHGFRWIKFSCLVVFSLCLSGITACQQSTQHLYDVRYGYPEGVTAEDIEYYESFSMPKMTASTTPPAHWIDTSPMAQPHNVHASNCPCCSGPVQPYVSEESVATQNTMTQPVMQSSGSVPAVHSYYLNDPGQPQFAVPPLSAPTNVPASTVPNGKFSANEQEQQNTNVGMIIRAQSLDTDDDFGFGGDDDDPWGLNTNPDSNTNADSADTGTTDDMDSDFDFGSESDTSPTVTVPATPPVAEQTPVADTQKDAEEQQRRQKEAALKARPTVTANDIQITFDRREKQAVVIDPALKNAGRYIVNDPQVYSEFRNPGGFSPRGQYGAWPQDEYLVDGGDDQTRAFVRNNWEIRGLDAEDTIVHYDTLDDRRLVEKSNRVHIYSPRFGSVRKIDGAVAAIEWQHYAGVQNRNLAVSAQTRIKTGRTEQNEIADSKRSQIIVRSANAGANTGEVHNRKSPMSYQNQDGAASLSQLLTHKIFTGAELAYLAQAKRQAVAWGGIDRVEVRINEQAAQAMIGQKTPEAVFILGEPETSPKLQLFKVASKETAQRGEIVEFMIRFDNVGSELVGNITIVDSLTARLEYIDGSAGASMPAEFFVEPNEVGSHILRWEITEPIKANDFGVVRFRCRVQ